MKLKPKKIQDIGLFAVNLKRFYEDLRTYACVLRSREIRRPNIKDRNADACFAQEKTKAREVLVGDLNMVSLFAENIGIKVDITSTDIIEFMDFCIAHQLQHERSWISELTDEELGDNE